MESGLTALRWHRTPPAGCQDPVMLLLTGYVRTEAGVAADIGCRVRRGGHHRAGGDRGLRRLITEAGHPASGSPHVAAAIAAGVAEEDDSPENRFASGLARVLDGVAALVEPPR